MTDRQPRRPEEVQAHRGASAVAPENTIAAFRAAREQGASNAAQTEPFWAEGLDAVITDNPELFLG